MPFTDPASYGEWSARMAKKPSIQYLHYSKAGGSSVCSLARLNNCTTITRPPGGRNCWDEELGDGPRWLLPSTRRDAGWLPDFHCTHAEGGVAVGVPPSVSRCILRDQLSRAGRYGWQGNTCEGRLRHTSRHASANGGRSIRAGFFANENFLPANGSVCAAEFLNVVMLREPIARVISAWSFMRQYWSQGSKPWPQTSEDRLALSPVVGNNYYVRQLLGQRGWSLQLARVTKSHFEEALRRLHEFDLVLVLETLGQCQALLRLGLGWDIAELPQSNIATGKRAANTTMGYAGTRRRAPSGNRSRDEALLLKYNRFDIALYQEAQRLAATSCAAFDVVAADATTNADARSAVAAYRRARRAWCAVSPVPQTRTWDRLFGG